MAKIKALQRQQAVALPGLAVEGRGIEAKLNALLQEATRNVRPSDRMIRFYNWVGRLPFHLGTLTVLLTSIDAIKVVYFAIKDRTDAALQVMYNSRFRLTRGPLTFGDTLWRNSYSVQTIRARGKFVKEAVQVLTKELVAKATENKGHPVITAVSLGSGTATSFLEGIASSGLESREVHVFLVDHNPRVLQAAQEKASILGLETTTFPITISEFFLERLKLSNKVHLFEMVGLANYFKEDQLRGCFQRIYKALTPEGYFLGTNFTSKEEQEFTHGAGCWPPMHYRKKEELLELLREAGFVEIWTGSCGLTTVWVAQKASTDLY